MAESTEPLQVEPGTLHAGGAKIGVAADTAEDSFSVQHRRMEDAMTGWSPAAQAAMEEKLDRWKSTHEQLITTVRSHAQSIQDAAREYVTRDSANADSMKAPSVKLD